MKGLGDLAKKIESVMMMGFEERMIDQK